MFLCYPQRIKQLKIYRDWYKRFVKVRRVIYNRENKRVSPTVSLELKKAFEKREKLFNEIQNNPEYKKAGIFPIPHQCGKACPYYRECLKETRRMIRANIPKRPKI